MSVLAVFLVAFLAMTGYSSALYCACNSGLSDAVLQKNIDYACGNGGDCTPILQNGACYNPNTVKNHCDYAVNSYYQKKGQVSGSCDFEKSAAVVQTAPPGQSSTCVYPSSASGSTTPPTGGSTTPPTGGSTTPPTGGSTTPGTPGGGTTGGGTGGSNSTTGGTFSPPGVNPTFGGGGLAPSGFDNSSARLLHAAFLSVLLPLLFSGLVWLKV